MPASPDPTAPWIIAVDDDATTRTIIASILQRHGYNVIACCGGAEMRAAMARVSPHVVLLDINMPGEDGLCLAEDVRGRFGFSVSIIMLTGSSDESDRAMAYEIGADAYLTKPCDRDDLLRMVGHYAASHVAAQ
ncbi:hypothetical protein A6A04_13905 [Paramagnetospirillum marisnigri]|uniref:Response regulatory domain-containing protein n=2 Tax=Paramagnetospirillum marisnigri TaxID=1285242 RepID=A0A178MU14_9PROT|nr:hypothetical protein A6A04_13905 [Paramagnetospirillum marisnigri]